MTYDDLEAATKRIEELEESEFKACIESQTLRLYNRIRDLQARIDAAVWVRIAHEIAWGISIFPHHRPLEFQEAWMREFFPECWIDDEPTKDAEGKDGDDDKERS